MEMDPNLIAFASAVISAVSIFISVVAWRSSDRTSRRMVEIEEGRDEQAAREGGKASVSASIGVKSNRLYELTVFNGGPGSAEDVKVYFDGKPAGECPIIFRGPSEDDFKTLHPSARIVYALTPNLGVGCQLPKKIRIEWVDASGEMNEWKSDLT